jgi:acyl carrier protein
MHAFFAKKYGLAHPARHSLICIVGRTLMRSVLNILIGLSVCALLLGFVAPRWFPIPWYAKTALFLVGVVSSIYLVRLTDASEKQRALRHMADRPPLADTDFGKKFFPPEHAGVASKLRRIMARHSPVDLSRLHPDDSIVEDIRMDALDSMSTVEFVVEVEKEFGIRIPEEAAEKMRTLRDVIDYVLQAQRALAD